MPDRLEYIDDLWNRARTLRHPMPDASGADPLDRLPPNPPGAITGRGSDPDALSRPFYQEADHADD